jgi:hypothetical protein
MPGTGQADGVKKYGVELLGGDNLLQTNRLRAEPQAGK